MGRRASITLIVLGAVAAGVIALRLSIGPDGIAWPNSGLVLELRTHRVLIGVAVGVSLAVGGVMLQSLLGNPLASPDLLGLASGAGLAIMVGVYLEQIGGDAWGAGGRAAAALVGSFGALGVVYALGQRRGVVQPVALILVGVVVSIICSAGIQLVGSMLPRPGLEMRRWLFGAITDDVPMWHIIAGLSIAGLGTAVGLWLGRAMDASSLSEDEAASVGVRIGALRVTLLLSAGTLTAGAVILAGPIGFVGLICPHVVRLGAGPSHRVLIAGSALAGVSLVVGADALVRALPLETGRIPIGVLTALVGGPVFIALLRREMLAPR